MRFIIVVRARPMLVPFRLQQIAKQSGLPANGKLECSSSCPHDRKILSRTGPGP